MMDDVFEKWLREEVTSTYDRVKNDPGLLMSRKDFWAALEIAIAEASSLSQPHEAA